MVTPQFRLTKYFFDRAVVRKRIGEQRARFYRNAGGYARTVARRSMRRVGKNGRPSQPGTPPKHHGGDPSLRTILYGFDPSRHSILIGPVLLNGSRRMNPTIPRLHEFGGRRQVREKLVPTKQPGGRNWVPVGRRGARPGQPVRIRLATFPPRPFMGPALEKTSAKFPQLWFGSGALAAA
jgi:hypothetical protein